MSNVQPKPLNAMSNRTAVQTTRLASEDALARSLAIDDIRANENTPVLILHGWGKAVSAICSLSDRAPLNESLTPNPHWAGHSLPSGESQMGKIFDRYATGE